MIAVPHQHSAGVAHDLGCQEQETQSRGRQRGVAQILGLGLLLPVEQHQPAVQVIGQHGQLEVHTVHGPSPRGMRRQARIVVGFFDQVLRPRPLSVKTHHRVDRRVEVGHEYPMAVLRRVEQLVLLRFVQLVGLRLLHVPQRHEPVGSPPSFRLVAKLALPVGIGARRSGPPRRLQLLYQSRGLLRRQHESAPRASHTPPPPPGSRIPSPPWRTPAPPFSAARRTRRPSDEQSVCPSAGLLCATPRPRTPASPPETSGSADSSSSRGVSGYTPCALPSVGRTPSAPSCQCPASLLSIPHGPLPTPAAASAAPLPTVAAPPPDAATPRIAKRCSAPAVPLPPESR